MKHKVIAAMEKPGHFLDRVARQCALKTDLTPDRCREAADIMLDVIVKKLQSGEPVTIEGFGRFCKPTTGSTRAWFWPTGDMMNALNNPRTPVDLGDVAKGLGVQATPTQNFQSQLPVHPLREEDAAVINLWIEARRKPETVTDAIDLLWENPSERRGWSESTANSARSTLAHFARRCPVPLLDVGYSTDAGPIEALRREITLYAADYAERAAPRLAAKYPSKYNQRMDLVWRTGGWTGFVRVAKDFYEWCENEGYRRPRSNPLAGIRIRGTIPAWSNGRVLVMSWYRDVLRYEHMKPKERVVLNLLANGLRRSEVAQLRLEHIDLTAETMLILGKGDKPRTVIMLPWTKQALEGWLRKRARSKVAMSPWVFPSRGRRGRLTGTGVCSIVDTVANRVFARPDQERIRRQITPHGFRRFYNSMRLNRGTHPELLRKEMGHLSGQMTDLYYIADEETMKADVRKRTKVAWF